MQYQPGDDEVNALPFSIAKTLVMYNIAVDDVRGNHGHFETEEIVVALRGGCTVDMDDGKGSVESVRISNPSDALLLYPHIWRTLRHFDEDTMLLVVASLKHDESDYIRDYNTFVRLASTWENLGGSHVRGGGFLS